MPNQTPREIWVRTTIGFSAYLDDPEMNAAAFTPDGWFRTGDVGRLDADGFLYLTGREDLTARGGRGAAGAPGSERHWDVRGI
jgi:long-subunit acyl-CoA synthetase (AMP-forming)